MNPLVLEVFRGSTSVLRSEFSEPSVTIGRGSRPMLSLDDPSLSELHAVVNVEDDGTILVLDLGGDAGGSGILVNGERVSSAPLTSGSSFTAGAFTIRVTVGEAATAADDRTEEVHSSATPVGAPVAASPGHASDGHAAEGHDAAGHAEAAHDDHEHDDIADVAAFVMHTANTPSERKRPPVLEVHQMWGNVLLSSRQFPRDAKAVTLGVETGTRWKFLGVDMGWVPAPIGAGLALVPLWSDLEKEWRADFVVPRENLPDQVEWTFFEQGAEGQYSARIAQGWSGFAEVDGQQLSFDQLVAAGKASRADGAIQIPLTEGMKLMVEGAGNKFFAQMVVPVPRVFVRTNEEVDWIFNGLLSFGAFIFLTVIALMWLSPPVLVNETNEIPDRFVELLLEKPELEKKDKKPDANPDAGEGAKAKKEEGKVGKKESKIEKTKGNKVEVKKLEIDRQIAENAGVLGAMDNSDLNQVLGASGLSSDLTSGIGGLIGTTGTQMGSGGLGGRGGGLGGGGTAEGLGGLGTKGMGSGSSGYGSGGGSFGAKGEGGIGQLGGDPIILGALDRSLIDEVIKRHMNQIKYCYQRELTKNPALGGKIVIKFTIAKDGTVSAASTKTTTMNNETVESCIVGRFMRMQFPEPKGGGIVIVSYPFIFSPG